MPLGAGFSGSPLRDCGLHALFLDIVVVSPLVFSRLGHLSVSNWVSCFL